MTGVRQLRGPHERNRQMGVSLAQMSALHGKDSTNVEGYTIGE